MKVKLTVAQTGLINGQPWPKVGAVVDLPDHVAQGMIDNGHAKRRVTGRAKSVETRPADTKPVETR